MSAQEMALQQGNLFQLLLQKAQTLLPVGQADIQVVDAGAVLLEKITDGVSSAALHRGEHLNIHAAHEKVDLVVGVFPPDTVVDLGLQPPAADQLQGLPEGDGGLVDSEQGANLFQALFQVRDDNGDLADQIQF